MIRNITWKIFSFGQRNVISYINTLAEKTALPLPGRLPQFRDYKVMKLPSSYTKISVYQQYKKATIEALENNLSLISFRKIWRTHCPYVTTMKPADDLCDVCRQNNFNIVQAANVDDTLKEAQLMKAIKHLDEAKIQREYYNSWRQESKSAKTDSLVVLSFDFAQNVSFPSSPQQVGVSYFRALRKCSIFGVQYEATQVQVNFLIDEEDVAGKGANAVVSMLHYYLEKMQPAEKLVLFADNCVGQNKNNTMIHYLLWRVLSGHNKKISLNFLLTGHTKFSPGRNFAILKSKYSRANVDCTQDFIEVVNSSSPNGYNIEIPTLDPSSKIRNVEWYEWDTSLRKHFKPIQGITKYHHFHFDSGSHVVKAQLTADSSEIILYEFEPPRNIGDIAFKKIIPAGRSNDRAWYLHDQIRSLCTREENKDLVAPKPAIAKNKSKGREMSENVPVNKQKIARNKSEIEDKNAAAVAPTLKIMKNKRNRKDQNESTSAPKLKTAKKSKKKEVENGSAPKPKIMKNKNKKPASE